MSFDINELVNASLAEMANSGRLSQVIAKHVEKAVEESVQSAVSYNSEFQKAIKEAIKTAVCVDFSGVGLAGYNDMVVKIVKEQLDQHMKTVVNRDICQNLETLLSPVPSEIHLSKLVDEFKEWIVDSYQQETTEMTLIVDAPYRNDSYLHGYRRIYLGKSSDLRQKDCEICITIDVSKGGSIVSMSFDGKDPKKTMFVGRVYGFERMLFQIYTSGTKIIINEDDCDTAYNTDNDD